MARLLITALERAGHKIGLASEFRSFEKTGDAFLQNAMEASGRVEADHLIDTFLSQPAHNRPEIWFTYHLYYKAPDYLGPAVSEALNIPYVVAEPSHAPKRSQGPWQDSHRSVTASLYKTDCAFCLTRHDMACVGPALQSINRLVYLPPFLDFAENQHDRSEQPDSIAEVKRSFGLNAEIILVAVGMMRPGDKFESYRQLAEALLHLDSSVSWQLLVVGDGEMQDETKFLFSSLNEISDKVVFAGIQPPEEMTTILSACDICVWPAAGEAYGMALLEAQAVGLPVVAGNLRGVPDVVQDGKTALLVPPGNPVAFAQAVKTLIENNKLREEFGSKAREFVRHERSLDQTAVLLNTGLDMALENHKP